MRTRNSELLNTSYTGWCITGHHKDCPKVVKLSMGTVTEKVCGCECHKKQGE